MKKSLFLILSILMSVTLWGQNTSSFTPQRLSSAVNSEYNDINPVISPDGKTLYFNRIGHHENKFGQYNSMDIWYSELQSDGSWTVAKQLPFPFNTARNNSLVSASTDGKSVIIAGIFSKKKANWLKRGLSVVTKTGDSTWSNPVKLKIPGYSNKNKGAYSNSYLSSDGNTLLLSFTKLWGRETLDLYVSRKNEKGKWGKPKKVKLLSDYGSIEAPFMSADNKFLYFAANNFRKEEFDIMRVSRMDETYRRWTSPVVLSDTINTIYWDSYFKTTSKGSWAYYCSDKTGSLKADIYRVKIFEENPFIVLSGTIINTTKNAPLAQKYTFQILSDGKVIDSVTINSDSAKYKLKLPLGGKYSLAASVNNFTNTSEIVDVTTVKEYTEQNLDLKVTPIPYVLVQGSLLNQKTKNRIPASALPRVALNGIITDSVIIDLNNGTYKIKVPYGSNHTLQVLAEKHTPDVEKLNLNDVDEYKVIDLNLYASEIKLLATLSGKVLSRKTNKPLPAGITPKIKVNDIVYDNATINKATGEYTIEIPIGQAYVVNASAEKYFPVYEPINLGGETGSIRIYKDLYLSPLEVGASVKLNNVFFETGKAVLMEESFLELDKVVNFLNEFPEVKIEIGGHTDNVGKPDKNKILSENRAAAVANYIKSKGITEDRISSKGYGQTKPVVPNSTPANKAKNRRVEFTILDI